MEMNYEMTQLIDEISMRTSLELQAAFPSNQDMQLAIYKKIAP